MATIICAWLMSDADGSHTTLHLFNGFEAATNWTKNSTQPHGVFYSKELDSFSTVWVIYSKVRLAPVELFSTFQEASNRLSDIDSRLQYQLQSFRWSNNQFEPV